MVVSSATMSELEEKADLVVGWIQMVTLFLSVIAVEYL